MRVEADTQISECSALMRLESVGAVLRYVEGDAGDGDGREVLMLSLVTKRTGVQTADECHQPLATSSPG